MFSISSEMIRAILPEIGLAVLALIVLAFDLVWRGKEKRNLGWLTAGGLLVVFVITLIFSRPGEESIQVWGGTGGRGFGRPGCSPSPARPSRRPMPPEALTPRQPARAPTAGYDATWSLSVERLPV